MSGTSLDGLDLCAAEFECTGDRWNYRIHAFETITYRGTPWPERLSAAYADRGPVRDQVSRDFATWCQDQWLSFNARHHFAAHAVAHHGHTVEHDPSRGITVQIGHEASVFTSSPSQSSETFAAAASPAAAKARRSSPSPTETYSPTSPSASTSEASQTPHGLTPAGFAAPATSDPATGSSTPSRVNWGWTTTPKGSTRQEDQPIPFEPLNI